MLVLIITALLVVICIFAPWLSPHDPATHPATQYPDGLSGLGAPLPPGHGIFRHALPQILVLVYSTLNFSTTVLFVAALSYVGIGVQPPTPDWGNMIADGSQYLTVSPWLVIFPGVFLSLSVLAFNLLGDGLRGALDPKRAWKAG